MVQVGTFRLVCLSPLLFLAAGSVLGKCFGTGCEKETDAPQPAASAHQLLQVTLDRQPTGLDPDALFDRGDVDASAGSNNEPTGSGLDAVHEFAAGGASPMAVEQMLSLLQSDQVASSDKPSAQHKAVLDFNKTLEDSFLKNIRDDHNLAQEQMNNLTNILAQCTSTFKNASTRADYLKQDQLSKKRQHEGCRATQVTLASDYKTARANFFDKFLAITKEPHSKRPASPSAAMDQYFKDMTHYWDQANKSYFDLKSKYDSANSALNSHETNCSSQQASFETSYCAWHTSASDAIDDYQDCWPKANQTFYATRAAVLTTGEHRKTEYMSVRRMQCMLAFFLDNAKRGSKATAKLGACKNQTSNTSFLTLKNITPANMENVSSVGNLSLKPGDAHWKTQEYSGIAVPSMLAKVQDCPSRRPQKVTTTSTTTPSGYELVTTGSCASPVTSLSECSAAAQALGLYDTTASDDRQSAVSYDPPYCYYESSILKFNAAAGNTGRCATYDQCLCNCVTPGGCGPSHMLFTGKGSTKTYENRWPGWYTKGSTVSSGNGKRGEYDTLKLRSIRFSDSSGKFAEYTLSSNYKGKSLRDIVVGCGLSSSSKNTGTGKWKTGHCSIGTLIKHSGLSNLNQYLRVGVGDGYSDSLDWCVFMLKKGNGNGDFKGNKHHSYHGFSFGSEHHTAGSPYQVYIYGS